MLRREAALSLALLTLALSLALLGLFTPGARVPAVAMANLLGGFVMLALAARLAAPPPRVRLGASAIAVAASAARPGRHRRIGQCLARRPGLHRPARMHRAGARCGLGLAIARAMARARGRGRDAACRRCVGAMAAPARQLRRRTSRRAARRHRMAPWPPACGRRVARSADRRGRDRPGDGSTGLPLVPVLLHNLGTALMLAIVVRLV